MVDQLESWNDVPFDRDWRRVTEFDIYTTPVRSLSSVICCLPSRPLSCARNVGREVKGWVLPVPELEPGNENRGGSLGTKRDLWGMGRVKNLMDD